MPQPRLARSLLPLLALPALCCQQRAQEAPQPAPTAPAPAEAPAPELQPIRISYPTLDGVVMWGMVGQVFERTDILERNGLEGQFVRCSDSPDLSWSVVHGDADVALITTGVLGVTFLCGRPYKLVTTLGGGGRNMLITAADSSIQRTRDLKGKTVENPILGGLLERFLDWDGLGPEDVTQVQQYRYHGESVEDLLAGKYDALMYWDPYLIPLLREGMVRELAQDPYHLEVVMQQAYIEAQPAAALDFLVALQQALYYVLQRPEQCAGWYSSISGLSQELVLEALTHAEIHEEHLHSKSIEAAHIEPTEQHIKDMKGVVGAMGHYGVLEDLRPKIAHLNLPDAQPLTSNELDLMDYLDADLPRRAEQKLRKGEPFQADQVQVTGLDPDATYLSCHGKPARRRGRPN